MKLPFPFRIATTLVSSLSVFLREDPQEFQRKVKERLRLANLPILSPTLNRANATNEVSSVQRGLIKQGMLSKAISYEGSDRSSFLALQAQNSISLLTSPIITGKTLHSTSLMSPSPVEGARVLFYLNNSLPYTQSGYTERTHQLLTALHKQGVALHAVTRLGYPVVVGKIPRSSIESIDGITYERPIPTIYSSSQNERIRETVRQLVSIAQRFKATILHTTTDYKNSIVVSQAAEILGIPWVYEVRGELESTWLSRFSEQEQSKASQSEFYQLAQAQETQAMKKASMVISLSEVSKKAMVKRGVDPDKIVVVPNGIDESLIGREFNKRAIRDELGLPQSRIIGSISSVVGYEGLDDLIRATHLIPDVTCLIVGDGDTRPELERLTRELDLTDRVIFSGHQPRDTIWKWYAALDVFALPRKDTAVTRVVTPIKALTAQALGIPVVASSLPALREVTGNQEIYTPAGDPEKLANSIMDAFSATRSPKNPEIKQRSWEKVSGVLTDFYRSN